MFLLSLPVEILLCIAGSLDQTRDLLALACLNRAANALFLGNLYRFNVRYQRSSALFWGVCLDKLEFVEMMLRDYQADANTTDDKSSTPIFRAIRTENKTMTRMLLFDKRADSNWQDQGRQAPLLYAIARDILSTATLLLDFDPCLNITDVKHRSATWYAIAFCDENLVQVLLKRGSDFHHSALLLPRKPRELLGCYSSIQIPMQGRPYWRMSLSETFCSAKLYEQAFKMSSRY